MKTKMSEAELQMHVVALLKAYARHDIYWFHPANGEERNKVTANRLKKMGVRKGAPDLFFVIDGQPIGVELKTEIGTMAGSQHEAQEDIERAGGRYFMARGLDEAIGVLNAIGAFKVKLSNGPKVGARTGDREGYASRSLNPIQ